MEKQYKRGVFIVMLFIVFIPVLQSKLKLIKMEPLKGAYTTPSRPQFTKESYFSGNYQEAFATYIQSKIGFKEWFIRTYNQIGMSLFNQPRVDDEVVIGKDGETLLSRPYINSYYGYTYSGKNKITTDVQRLVKLDSLLTAKNKTLLILFTPGKASFYPELIPATFKPSGNPSNYSIYKQEFEKTNLHFIDLKSWYIDLKK